MRKQNRTQALAKLVVTEADLAQAEADLLEDVRAHGADEIGLQYLRELFRKARADPYH